MAAFFGFEGWLVNCENCLAEPACVDNLLLFLRYPCCTKQCAHTAASQRGCCWSPGCCWRTLTTIVQ